MILDVKTVVDSINHCQPNPELSAVLLQMLLSSMKQPGKLAGPGPAPVSAAPEAGFDLTDLKELDADINNVHVQVVPTTLITSTLVSTITQTLSRVVSIWFRNVRIPTTIFTKKQQVVTDYITVTSTLQVQPTLLRHKREVQPELEDEHRDDSSLLQPSILDGSVLLSSSIETPQLGMESIFKRPKVLQAWNQFISVLDEATREVNQRF